MTTGEKIAALRREHKLSQEALGEKLGLSRQAVSKWEADQAVPTMDNLMELSRLFSVPVDTLLRPDAPFPAAPAEDGAGKENEDAPAAPETPSAPSHAIRNKVILIGGAALLCVSLACSAVCAWSTVRLRAEVDGLRSLVNGLSLNSTVYYPQTDTNTFVCRVRRQPPRGRRCGRTGGRGPRDGRPVQLSRRGRSGGV